MSEHPGTEHLHAYLDAELDQPGRAELERHLSHCSGCRVRLERAHALFEQIGSLPEVPIGRNLAPAVVARLASRQEAPFSLPWWLALQGVVAAAVSALWLYFQPLRLPALPPLLEQFDLLVWWTRWVIPRLSDFQMALAALPKEAANLMPVVPGSQMLDLAAGLPWLPIMAVLGVLWLAANGWLLGGESGPRLPWGVRE